MAFVIDSSEWNFDNWPPELIVEKLENILERIHIALERSENVWFGEELQNKEILQGHDLWSLRSEDSPLTLPRNMGRVSSLARQRKVLFRRRLAR